jgi:S-adenosylmethionine:tRNA ribosyltransferase-isomerase
MRRDDFDYELPDDLIAQTPVEPRDSARLLVDRGSSVPTDHRVAELPALLGDGDLLVVNTTKVIPARLHLLRHSGGAVEVLLLEPLDGARRSWEALVRPARKLRAGERLVAGGCEVVEVQGRSTTGDTMIVNLLGETDPVMQLQQLGEMPLPPYIRERLVNQSRYQTVYAEQPGSAAAPTAGLHLTEQIFADLAGRGVQRADVELVVGLDTFRPITTVEVSDHTMHTERYRVPDATAEACRQARRVVAVGTTSVRALESAAATGRAEGRTDLFIRRPFDWQAVDVMMTNFHLPGTTLLVMIDAFVGERWRRLYSTAIERRYRFLSFGDAMLLDRKAS